MTRGSRTGSGGIRRPAVEIGRYTLSGREMPVLDSGKYIVVWKREGDAWRWHRDIWNSSRPLA